MEYIETGSLAGNVEQSLKLKCYTKPGCDISNNHNLINTT